MSTGIFYGVGLGPGDPELITYKGLRCLQNIDAIFTAISRQGTKGVASTILGGLPKITAPCHELTFVMSKDVQERRACINKHAETIYKHLLSGKNCAFATLGDPLTYSTCGYLIEALRQLEPQLDIRLIPGVNSWSALAANSGEVLVEDNARLIIQPEYKARDKQAVIDSIRHKDTVVLLKTYQTKNKLVKTLSELDGHKEFLYGAKVGLEEEFVSKDLSEIEHSATEYLSMLIVKKKPVL